MTNFGRKLLTILITLICFTGCKASEKNTFSKIDYEYYPVEEEEKDVAIIIIGGSGGGIPVSYHNLEITKGCPVMLLGYYKTPNTPTDLVEIDLEYFNLALKMFKTLDSVKDKKIVVIGTSRGGELALLWASVNPEINGVVGIVPSSVVFQADGGALTSSWALNGEPLPFVRYTSYDYSITLDQAKNIDEASIKVENINGAILLFSGVQDPVWPSFRMSNEMINRLNQQGFKHYYDHISYEDAGHSFNEDYMMGGSYDGNKAARLDSAEKIIEFINKLNNM